MSTNNEAAARQVKIARMIAALDAQRTGRWAVVRDGLDQLELLDPAQLSRFWHGVADVAGVRCPSDETMRLAMTHVRTLAACEADPFAGLPS